MTPTPRMTRTTIGLEVSGVALEISTMVRTGERAPIVFLHGFGSTKEDYADVERVAALDGRPCLAYDAPGCGRSGIADPSRLSIDFLVETALAMLDAAAFDRFVLVGHSMGGLTALRLARAVPHRMLGFASIEGNLAPEDCFLSRQVLTHPADDARAFFDAFIARVADSPAHASALYATSLESKVRHDAVEPIFRSMVALSDGGTLLETFLGLPCPTLFMHGDANGDLSYLPRLRASGVEVVSIPECGHFPMYSNPPAMWRAIAAFAARCAP